MTVTRLLTFACLASLASAAYAQKGKEPTTRLDVTSKPEGAIVRVDHQDKGVTPLALTDLQPGPHLVQVSRAGYRDAFDTVILQPGIGRTAAFTLEPLTGILLVTSTPSGSEVSLKGLSLGITPLLVTTLESGAHRLTLSSPGFQTKEVDVRLEGRVPVKCDVTLMADSGTLDVSSDPSGAEVFINGIARGETPCRIDRIPGGSVALELRSPGFQPHARDISLAAGETQTVNVPLKPLPGTLRVVTIPEAARVYIDDEFKGESPFDLPDTKPGTYRVRVEKPGHEPAARDVTVGKGAAVTEEFRLTRNTGRVELTTAPSGATVLIDGRKVGITLTRGTDTTAVSDPYAVEELLEGDHEIEIFRKGFATQKRAITVKRGETLTLQFKLQRQFIPNYEVTTTRSYHKGVLEFMNEEGIRIETSPGISQTIPMKDVKKHGPLREGE